MSEITILLQRMQQGDSVAGDEFASLVYAELRRIAAAKMARENPGQTLQATSLVHEAWLHLGDGAFANRAHFFSAAAEAMRRILVDRARRKLSGKRGGRAAHLDIDVGDGTKVDLLPEQNRTVDCLRIKELWEGEWWQGGPSPGDGAKPDTRSEGEVA